jgi:hypothetical protein
MYIDVPFDEAKFYKAEFGARWDPQVKKWYVIEKLVDLDALRRKIADRFSALYTVPFANKEEFVATFNGRAAIKWVAAEKKWEVTGPQTAHDSIQYWIEYLVNRPASQLTERNLKLHTIRNTAQ